MWSSNLAASPRLVALVAACVAALCLARVSRGVPHDDAGDPPPGVVPPGEVTRRDVAWSFQNFEQALRQHPPEPLLRAGVVQHFDWIGNEIVFRGALATGVRELDKLADALRPDERNRPADRAARALRVDVEPAVPVADPAKPAPVRVMVRPLYVLPVEPTKLTLRLRALDADEPTAEFPIVSTGSTLDWSAPAGLAPGRYVWEAVTPAGQAWPLATWDVLSQPPAALRQSLLSRLAAIETDDPALRRSLLAARSRAGLLTDKPDPGRTASFLANLTDLSRDVPAEVAALERGENPYANRGGDYWRTIDAIDGPPLSIPARVYAPESAVKKIADDDAVPLVIALHGAGGDENLFMDGYGAGEIKRVADAHGVIVVSPATLTVMADFRSLGIIVAAMGEAYRIDPDRVFVVGHSLGAMTAGLWAGQQPDRLAGVALIAGGAPDVQLFPSGEPGEPPVGVRAFVAAAQHDTIFPADRMERAARAAMERGAKVTFRRYANEGHVTVAGAAVGDVVAWLLTNDPNDVGDPRLPRPRRD